MVYVDVHPCVMANGLSFGAAWPSVVPFHVGNVGVINNRSLLQVYVSFLFLLCPSNLFVGAVSASAVTACPSISPKIFNGHRCRFTAVFHAIRVINPFT